MMNNGYPYPMNIYTYTCTNIIMSSDSRLDEGEFSHDSLGFVLLSLLLYTDLDVGRYQRRDFSSLHAITKKGGADRGDML